MFAKRTQWKLQSNRIDALRKSLAAQDIEILDLTESNPTRCRFSYLQKNLLNFFTDPSSLTYEPSPFGISHLREKIAETYISKGLDVQAGRIILTSSTSEAYSFLFRLLVGPGESVLIPRPSYPLFDYLATLNDVSLQHYPLHFERKWMIDIKALPSLVSPATKAVILVHPNNPTGNYVKEGEFRAMSQLAAERELAIISDEVFADYVLEKTPARIPTLGVNASNLTFSLGGLSKTLGLPQMKLSWILVSGPEHLVSEALKRLEIILDTFLPVSPPVQHAAVHWFSMKQIIQNEISSRLRENKTFLAGVTSKHDWLNLLPAEGGWYSILRVPRIHTEEDWILEFLGKDHVLVHPGYFFDFEEEAYLVVSLLPPADVFEEGIHRIVSRMKGYCQ